ncbi:MAG: hypothetical protein INR62_00920 [Rhodospirillales bacterium]|nr:hypothetical protein [Acetobacter sp.]
MGGQFTAASHAAELTHEQRPSVRQNLAAAVPTKIKAGLKLRLEADVEDYEAMLRDGWAGSMDGLVEQIEGDAVFVRLVDGRARRFGSKQFEEVTVPYDWQGEIMWDRTLSAWCLPRPLGSTSLVLVEVSARPSRYAWGCFACGECEVSTGISL